MNQRLIVITLIALSGLIALIAFLRYFHWALDPPVTVRGPERIRPDSWFLEQEAHLEELLAEEALGNKVHHRNRAFRQSPDGHTVVVRRVNNTIELFNVTATSTKLIHVLKGHTDLVISLAFSPDGNTILSGSRDKTIRLWDAKSGECLTTHLLQGEQQESR